jgi:SAM-dependent methyltransferase
MDIRAYNREAWNRQVAQGNEWTRPVSREIVASARRGDWSIVLTETKSVPRDWFPADLAGRDVLCLASGGGQQGPVLAAAGANVTVFDNSPAQLARDREVAEREGLLIHTVEGDMRDLHDFADASFDLIIHPVSNIFVPEVRPVWREAFRVLRAGGELLADIANPYEYVFDREKLDQTGEAVARFSIPYADLDALNEAERLRAFGPDAPLEWSHTLEDQIGGQLDAGFVLVSLYEDHRRSDPIARFMPSYIATRARKLAA